MTTPTTGPSVTSSSIFSSEMTAILSNPPIIFVFNLLSSYTATLNSLSAIVDAETSTSFKSVNLRWSIFELVLALISSNDLDNSSILTQLLAVPMDKT